MWENIYVMFCLGVGLRILALIGMYLISNPKRPKLNPPRDPKIHSEPENKPLTN